MIKRTLILLIFTVISIPFHAQENKRIKTTLLPGTTVKGTLIISGAVPVEGSSSGTAPVVIKLSGYAISANGRKINMDGAIVMGWAEGDYTAQKIKVFCNGLSYYDYNNNPVYTEMNGFVSYKGEVGVKGEVIVSKQDEAVAKQIVASTLETLANLLQKSNILGINPAQNNVAGTVIQEAGSSSFSKLAEFYTKLASQSMPQIFVQNNKTVAVTFINPCEFYTKEFIADEEK